MKSDDSKICSIGIVLNDHVDIDILNDKKISIIGYGNQGRAQALNLHDSGINVCVGLRASSSSNKIAQNDGLITLSIKNAVKEADVISVLISDKHISQVWEKLIFPNLKEGQTILFSHGYNVHYKLIKIPDNVNVVMVAPSGGGNLVREEFKNGRGVPTLLAVHQDYTGVSDEIIKAYSKAIGGTRVCAFYSTFKEETETDLFGEQAILTGGIPYMINKSFKVLLEAGYSPIVAWFVCYYELKTIIDLFHKNGFEYLYKAISDTARYGGVEKGKFLMDDDMEKKLKTMLDDIQTGKFHKEFTKSKPINELDSAFDEIEKINQYLLKLVNKK